MWTKTGFVLSSVLVVGLAVASASNAGPAPCDEVNPVTTINTLAKGQSPTNNAKVSTAVTGNIVGAGALGSTDNRISVCAGTTVTTVITDTTGTATVTKTSPGVVCGGGPACTIAGITATERYTVRSFDGTDTDTLTFLPE